jgi:CubicO group peptidase (beta-lactamase class C family)
MKRLLVVLLTLVGGLAAQSTNVDKIVQTLAKPNEPGLTVEVLKDGKPIYRLEHGVRQLGSSGALHSQTNFRLASVTKQFTAMTVMLLVHDKKLTYETTLEQIFPDFPEYGKKITVRNLLNHTSGLPDYEDLMEQANGHWTEDRQITDSEVFKLLERARSGKFAPGTNWSYSNSGYVLLGVIVAKIAGMPFQNFLSERIFKPLRMDNTIAYVKGNNSVPERAFGHVVESSKLMLRDQSSTSATLGDGGVYSNLEDLAKWDKALAKHTLLNQSEFAPALDAFRLPSGEWPQWSSDPGDASPLEGAPVMYGFGWFLNPYKGQRRMWHYGDTTGFQTAIQRFPDERLTVIVLCNRTDINPTKLAEQIADLYLKH